MTEAEILDRVEKLPDGMAMRFKSDAERLEWLLDGLADLSLDLATLPYLEANDRRPRHPGKDTPRTPDRSEC